MVVVHFIENNSVVLSQLRDNIPVVDENIKIKGRKGKVVSVKEDENKQVQVHVILEQVVKNQPQALDNKKKKR
ncbi:hypothetical protein [Bacillus sp. FJAT-49736]|uniref:hypothetical protein n=1 Tax=Bacillus sp. FJAT-49736 TaxID=2833582 RepID=UPI001BCA2DDD|nr:hypothetical protein [Bacillus sp. FJAT-49736]MBS4173026.1 hypothetical protein [Bacillus sp. FJAT-49736]